MSSECPESLRKSAAWCKRWANKASRLNTTNMKKHTQQILKDVIAERDALIEQLSACKAAVVLTILGTVEESPTHEGNYLQRLRELVDREKAFFKLEIMEGELGVYKACVEKLQRQLTSAQLYIKQLECQRLERGVNACPNCGGEIVTGAQIYICDKCGRECCTQCSENGEGSALFCCECNTATKGTT